MKPVLGIDLGTTYSVMATLNQGVPEVILNAEGEPLTPSVVGFGPEGGVIVGDLAKQHAVCDPENTVASIKRKMGSSYTRTIRGKTYTPTLISSFILRKLKKDAQQALGCQLDEAVITVPAYFSDVARQATKDAAAIAGLSVMRIINEPTAATLAYGLDQRAGELVMVWDLGGGTFDVSILEFSGGVYEVRSTCGNVALGGDDWTACLLKRIQEHVQKVWKLKNWDSHTQQRLLNRAESLKCELTTQEKVTCWVSPSGFLRQDHGRCPPVEFTVSQKQFEQDCVGLMQKLLGPATQALKDAKLKVSDLDKIILVGGATRMPMVRSAVAEFGGQDPFVDIDPDKVVAIGAAVQAGVLQGQVKNVVLVDVIPLSLGIETQGGLFCKLIGRNRKVPVSQDRIFTTAEDNQPEVKIHVLQGERELADQNLSLGTFTLSDMPLAPRGVPKINVKFSVDENGMLEVSAGDIYDDENEKSLRIRSDRLGRADIERLVAEAQAHHIADGDIKEKIEARLHLERVVSAAAETISAHPPSSPMASPLMLAAEALIAKGQDLLQTGLPQEMKACAQELKRIMDEFTQEQKKRV